VQVAKLAGVPAPVVVRAREVLDRLESKDQSPAKLDDLPLFAMSQAVVQAPAKAAPSAVETSLADLDIDGMSPREALEALYRLKGLLRA
jgi:DNA mismatch repair protein MutS